MLPLELPLFETLECHVRGQEKVNVSGPDGLRRAMANDFFAKLALRGMIRGGDGKSTMRKALMTGLAGALLAFASGMAAADVREGVDAWTRGDYKKAVDEWRPAAIAGDGDAQFNMGQAYTLGRGVPADIAMAESWFRKAALQGHIQAETKYGLVLFDEGKRTEAAPWLEKAVTRGEPRAQLVLGTMLFNGDGVERDWPRAYALLVRSAAAGTPRASEVQAQMDTLIPVDQRQQGLVLARRYEAEAQRPQLPPEIAGQGTATAMRGTDLPPSSYDPSVGHKPEIAPLRPVKSPPLRQRPAPPVVVAAHGDGPAPLATERGGWRVQLGAFGDPGNARKVWAQVGGRFPGATVAYVKGGALTRVLVGPYGSKAAAAAACGAVKPCVPVSD